MSRSFVALSLIIGFFTVHQADPLLGEGQVHRNTPVPARSGTAPDQGPAATAAQEADQGPRTRGATMNLVSFWSDSRADSFTAATPAGKQSALGASYDAVRIEGAVFADRVSGTVPLELYWHPDRRDNFSTASAAGRSSALAAGYRLVRVQGYVHSEAAAGAMPLRSYWSAGRTDNLLTATPEGERAASAAGYRFVRTEGYVFPARALIDSKTNDAKKNKAIEQMEEEARALEAELKALESGGGGGR